MEAIDFKLFAIYPILLDRVEHKTETGSGLGRRQGKKEEDSYLLKLLLDILFEFCFS